MFGRRLGGFQKVELGFPITQNVRLDTDDLADFADLKINLFRQTRRHSRIYSDAEELGADSGEDEEIPLRLFFMIWLALKVRTFRPTMMISSPVCGFRPFRGRLVLTTKFPKPEIFTFSPRSKQPLMMSNVASTTSVASFFENPTFSHIRVIISAVVILHLFYSAGDEVTHFHR